MKVFGLFTYHYSKDICWSTRTEYNWDPDEPFSTWGDCNQHPTNIVWMLWDSPPHSWAWQYKGSYKCQHPVRHKTNMNFLMPSGSVSSKLECKLEWEKYLMRFVWTWGATYNLCVSIYNLCVRIYNLCVSMYNLCVPINNFCVPIYNLCVSIYNLCVPIYNLCVPIYNFCVPIYNLCVPIYNFSYSIW